MPLVHHVPNITVGKLDDLVIPQPVNQDNPNAPASKASGDAEHKDPIHSQQSPIESKSTSTKQSSKRQKAKRKASGDAVHTPKCEHNVFTLSQISEL